VVPGTGAAAVVLTNQARPVGRVGLRLVEAAIR
jgi:hypothetical protein